jgi:eukaryotic-like serine/threonine-protein kinase
VGVQGEEWRGLTVSASAPTPERAEGIPEGTVVGAIYRVGRLLGRGGMGDVYEARDLSLDRVVALKTARGACARMLREEARALAAVRHPALPAVYGLLEEHGTAFLAMERIYGVVLHKQVHWRNAAHAPFALAEILDILIGIAEGLGAIHRAGLAHRDLKPENVMLAAEGRVVLMDLGISIPEVIAGGANVSGTPQYMAPETIRQRVIPGTAHLIDLYALGVIAFELAAGHRPFEGLSTVEILTRHVDDEAPDLRGLRPDLPPSLCEIIGELLAKDPAARPQGVASLLPQLRAVQARQEMRAHGEPPSVLIVDDDEDMRAILELFLRRALPSVEIGCAIDGMGAIRAVQKRAPQLMLLDLDLPLSNGIEVCMFLRGTRAAERTQIVLVSGRASEHDRELLRALGVNRFLTKDECLEDAVSALVRETLRP